MRPSKEVLETGVCCPPDLATAARRHGRHFARYLLAGQFAQGKVVIDAACGSGYGAAYLATVAARVVGLDMNPKLLAHAQAAWPAANLTFQRHDLHEPIRLGAPAGLVTSFETLEHVRDPRRCLSNLVGALSNDGVAILSVPNGTKELRSARPKDYHLTHFTAEALRQLLAEQFQWVEERSQAFRPTLSYRLGRLVGRKGHPARCYHFVPGFLDEAKTWVALCRRPRRQ